MVNNKINACIESLESIKKNVCNWLVRIFSLLKVKIIHTLGCIKSISKKLFWYMLRILIALFMEFYQLIRSIGHFSGKELISLVVCIFLLDYFINSQIWFIGKYNLIILWSVLLIGIKLAWGYLKKIFVYHRNYINFIAKIGIYTLLIRYYFYLTPSQELNALFSTPWNYFCSLLWGPKSCIQNFYLVSYLIYWAITFVILMNLAIDVLKLLWEKNNPSIPYLLPDTPLYDEEEDRLWTRQDAIKILTVLRENKGIPKVISIENSWGVWKSTVINFIKNEADAKDFVFYDFNPWLFNNGSELLKNFLDGLKNTIQINYYEPRIETNVDEILSSLSYSIGPLWINLDHPSIWRIDLKDAKKNLKAIIDDFPKEIVIIIDDLDRVDNKTFYSVLQILELCKDLWVTYIACFDNNNFNIIEAEIKTYHETNQDGKLNNITEEKIDNEHIRNYIEKIVTFKFSIQIDERRVKQFFFDTFQKLPGDNKYSESSLIEIRNGIEKLFLQENFDVFKPYIGNIRSIKRLYNAYMLVFCCDTNKIKNIFDTDTPQWLFFLDFIKLMIVYVYFDHIYRKIQEEVSLANASSRYIFSLDKEWCIFKLYGDYRDHFYKYKYRPGLEKYLKFLKVNERNIVMNLFVGNNRLDGDVNVSGDSKHSLSLYAPNDRLDSYLRILDTVPKIDQSVRVKEALMLAIRENGTNIAEIYEMLSDLPNAFWEFIKNIEENPYAKSNKPTEIKKWQDTISGVIEYIIEHFWQKPAILERVDHHLVKLLENMTPSNNTLENCLFIWDYCAGKGNFVGKGIIDRLCKEKWGARWLYVLMWMRSIASRWTNYYNYRRWVSGQEELNQTDDFYQIQFSLEVYKTFKRYYIEWQINIFEKISSLPESDFVSTSRHGLLVYTLYQLTNQNDGIGGFDIDSTQSNLSRNWWIFRELNEYYFDFCFRIEQNGVSYFIEILFGLFIRSQVINDEYSFESDLSSVFAVLSREKVINYIDTHSDEINSYLAQKDAESARYGLDHRINIKYSDGYQLFIEKLFPPVVIQPGESSTPEISN